MAATTHAQNIKNDTQTFITTALLQLLGIEYTTEKKEKLSTLTVSKVCKRAGVSRMAFYRNFDSIEQVIYNYYQPKIAESFDVVRQNVEAQDKLNHQLHFFNRFNKDLIVAEKQGYEPIIQEIFTEEIEKFYSELEDEYMTAFLAAGIYAIWHKWIINGQDKALSDIHELLRKVNRLTLD